MSSQQTQYHHYIPQFVLKQFAYTTTPTKRSPDGDGLLHVFNVCSGQFSTEEVRRSCGTYNLYYRAGDMNHMRIERLFSALEGKTAPIFVNIRNAAQKNLNHVNILEQDIHVLFKFLVLSLRRSKLYRDDMESPYRENDFMFQRLFEESRKEGRSDDPGEVWLEQLLYLLETSHKDLLADAESTGDSTPNISAKTYKYFVEKYTLQVWRAADRYEFFLNESLVDFEGDTQSFLGTEVDEKGSQLIWVTTNDLIHLILPVSPQIAVVFCDESRRWESPFADAMQRCNIPFPQNSLLAGAPHKDIVSENVPAKRTRRKTWPATVEWRVSIDRLSQHHHRIIASYSLSHSRSVVVVQNRVRFEKARKELNYFSKEREETWKSRGIRYGDQTARQYASESPALSSERLKEVVDDHISALDEVLSIVRTTREPPKRNKENMYKFWLAFQALQMLSSADTMSPSMRVMHPAVRAAIEADYPPKRPEHRDLVTINFAEFFNYGIGEEMFAGLISDIEKRISELVSAEGFQSQFDAAEKTNWFPRDNLPQKLEMEDNDISENPAFKSIFRAAQTFDTLVWMFEERQDILATFVQRSAVPMKASQPNIIRMRARRC